MHTSYGFQLCTLLGCQCGSTYQDDSGLVHLLGYLLHKESGQASRASSDEIAPALFPGEASWICHQWILLPLSHPALAVSIADVRLVWVVLVLTQPNEQFFLLQFTFYLYQLSS